MKQITIDLRLVYEVDENTPRGSAVAHVLSRLNFGQHNLDVDVHPRKMKLRSAEVLDGKETKP